MNDLHYQNSICYFDTFRFQTYVLHNYSYLDISQYTNHLIDKLNNMYDNALQIGIYAFNDYYKACNILTSNSVLLYTTFYEDLYYYYYYYDYYHNYSSHPDYSTENIMSIMKEILTQQTSYFNTVYLNAICYNNVLAPPFNSVFGPIKYYCLHYSMINLPYTETYMSNVIITNYKASELHLYFSQSTTSTTGSPRITICNSISINKFEFYALNNKISLSILCDYCTFNSLSLNVFSLYCDKILYSCSVNNLTYNISNTRDCTSGIYYCTINNVRDCVLGNACGKFYNCKISNYNLNVTTVVYFISSNDILYCTFTNLNLPGVGNVYYSNDVWVANCSIQNITVNFDSDRESNGNRFCPMITSCSISKMYFKNSICNTIDSTTSYNFFQRCTISTLYYYNNLNSTRITKFINKNNVIINNMIAVDTM